MAFQEHEGIRSWTFDSLGMGQVTHAVFTRHGGVSAAPWNSLNVGGTVGDQEEHVIQNRVRSFEAVGRAPESIYDVWQVHSADVVIASQPRVAHSTYIQADAILTNNPAVTLFMRFADCVPILLHDPVRKVVGIVHAGWQGTVKGAVRTAVRSMIESYRSDPADIRAAIGPSIGPDHYEVGPEVVVQVQQTFRENAEKVLTQHSFPHFDLWKANSLWLQQAGVHQIEISGLCTACNTQDWFSHRAEKGKTGRFGALIALKGN